jgi:hypothetical protein
MRIEVRYEPPGHYETAIAERDDPGAVFERRTHASVADVDAALRAHIKRAKAWGHLKLPILVEGISGPLERIPEDLRAVLVEITRQAEVAGSFHRSPL